MLTAMCSYLRNYFLRDYLDPDASIHHGTFTITDGQIQTLHFLSPGQYFRVIGSVYNDGVWQYQPGHKNASGPMHNEVFEGTIWAMQIPPAFLTLADEIQDWIAEHASALNSPYQSESFGGYSYSKASGGAGGSGSAAYSWQDQFAAQLAPYRRLTVL